MSRSMKYMRHKKQETALRHDRCIANNAKKKISTTFIMGILQLYGTKGVPMYSHILRW